MTSVKATTTLTCELSNGKTIQLTADDCAAILNAMARRRMLCVMCEDIPAGYSDLWTEECCAWRYEGEGDECVVLAANTAEFTEATPVQKKKVAKKTPRPAKRKETR
jgi:hypothetical protein